MIRICLRFIAALATASAIAPALPVPASAGGGEVPSAEKDLNGFMRFAIEQLCIPAVGGPVGLTQRLGAILVDGVRPIQIGDNTVGWRANYRLRSGDELRARQQGLDGRRRIG